MIHRRRNTRFGQRSRHGTATVETAIVLPVLLTLLFGMLELGLMARSSIALHHVGREAVRVAIVGGDPTRINSFIGQISSGLNDARLASTLEYRALDPDTGNWGSWIALATGEDGLNSAHSGDQLRVSMQYQHQLVSGDFFAELIGASEDNTVPLQATVVAVRE